MIQSRNFKGKKQTGGIAIRHATYKDIPVLDDLLGILGPEKEADYFEQQFEHAKEDGRLVLVASVEKTDAAWCILNWEPKYPFFKAMNIPEIQDLNVLPEFRRRGVATAMIAYCESLARKKGLAVTGIGVGLYAAFGPAQRLYVKLGYIPDGNGINYDRRAVAPGEFRPIDDQLCLMMVKEL